MRILLASNHRYPAYGPLGSGRHPRDFPSGSAPHLQDLLARGLAKLGHDVRYLLRHGGDTPPPGVRLVGEPMVDIDIYQTTTVPGANIDVRDFVSAHHLPSIFTCHLDRSNGGEPAGPNWIFVARSLARAYGRERVILNGIDPADCIFSATKSDDVLFMASMERAIPKGLDIALALSRRLGFRLVVAGTALSYQVVEHVAALCQEAGADYLGDIRGTEKAERIAAAKAVLLPSRTNEGSPLTLIEAMMSGTPVIASTAGGIPEVVSPDTGFLCTDEAEYVRAIENLAAISPDRCREVAFERFHYMRMVRDYVREFETEIAASAS
jgi:glycosyltransferase involved in cell wall biosynthesis